MKPRPRRQRHEATRRGVVCRRTKPHAAASCADARRGTKRAGPGFGLGRRRAAHRARLAPHEQHRRGARHARDGVLRLFARGGEGDGSKGCAPRRRDARGSRRRVKCQMLSGWSRTATPQSRHEAETQKRCGFVGLNGRGGARGGMRRVRLVREEGRGVSSQYGREGGGGGGARPGGCPWRSPRRASRTPRGCRR